MATPFAALETRINAAAQSRLANAQASINGGAAIAGFFDQRAADVLSYAQGVQPQFECPESLAGNVLEDDAIEISNDAAVVLFSGRVSRIVPDGTGWLTLSLQDL